MQRGLRVDERRGPGGRREVLTPRGGPGTTAVDGTGPPPAAAPDRIFSRTYIGLVVGIFSTVFLIAFETFAVATALPIAAGDLNGVDLYAWSFTALLITSLVATVGAGEYNDRHGPRLPLLIGSGVFVAGLLVGGTAASMWVFIVGRAVQGLGAGLVVVSLYVVVARAFPDSLRPRMVALMSSGWVLPSIIGPLVAGYVAENLHWRWVFLGIAPLVIPSVALMAGRLGGLTAPPSDGVVSGPRGARRVLLAVGTAAGVASLQYAGQHLVWQSAVFAVVGLALLLPTVRQLLPRGALRFRRGLPSTIMMRGLLAGAFFGAEAFIPLMLVTQRGLSATQAGASLTGAALGWALGSWLQGRPSTRVPRNRLVQIGSGLVGLTVVAAAFTVMGLTPAWTIAVAWAVGGLGMGLAMSSITVLTFEQSPTAEQGANAAALQISDATLSVLFVGIGGTILAAGGADTAGRGTFLAIFIVTAALAAASTAVAPRVRAPTSVGRRD